MKYRLEDTRRIVYDKSTANSYQTPSTNGRPKRHRFGIQVEKSYVDRDSRTALECLPETNFDRNRAVHLEVPLTRRANRDSGFKGTRSVTLYSGRATKVFVKPITHYSEPIHTEFTNFSIEPRLFR